MFQNLSIFQTAFALAKHAGSQQATIAQNIANADTPGFQARQIPSFQETMSSTSHSRLKVSRSGHQNGGGTSFASVKSRNELSEPSPNGNSVSVEEEMLKSVSVTRSHDRALAIYRHGMTVLRTTLGR